MSGTRALTSAGLSVKSLDEIREDYEDAIHGSSQFGEECVVGPDSVTGQVIDVHANQEVELDDLAQALYDAWDIDNAEGTQLDILVALSGLKRKAATYSTATLTLSGTPTTVIPAGKRARVPDGPMFALNADATIGGGGTVDAAATCTVAGAQEAASGAINEIVDSVSGWTGVTNAADAIAGEEQETDAELRLRHASSFALGGNCTDHAIRAALEAVEGVTHATVISNRDLTTDSNGIPGKAFLCVLWPTGLDVETIGEAIWKSMPAGIRAHGSTEATVTDDQGYEQTVRWNYASQQECYLHAEITKDPGYPATGDDLVEDTLVAYGNSLLPGADVLPDMFEAVCQLGSAALAIDPIPGIRSITVTAKIAAAPTAGDTGPIAITLLQIARFSEAHTTVNSA